MNDTSTPNYTQRLLRLEGRWWKRWIGVQAPYRWNIRRLKLGYTLDIGCGIGRNLLHLDGNGVGIDHNPDSVHAAAARGLTAFTPQQFFESSYCTPGRFDSILLAHVAEHMKKPKVIEVIWQYLPFLKPKGRLVLICPQKKGYQSDSTHVEFLDFDALKKICIELGFSIDRCYSFPFPLCIGKIFTHNEFVVIGSLGLT